MARILIVDDDELWSLMLVRRLVREEHQADFVLTAEDALERIHSATEPFEILLIDHRLGPGMDGIDLLRQVRAVSPDSDAVLFTGLDEPGVGLQAYQAGAYRYLNKPFEPQELILIIQSLLDWRATRYERNWLSILNQVVEDLQRANTVAEVGEVLVNGGIRLGFDRSRFYQVRDVDDAPTLFGICQSGVNQVVGFETIVRPINATRYSKVAYEQRAPVFFEGHELGPSFLVEYPTQDGLPYSYGEWVSIPLFSGEQCIGILNMNNADQKRTVHPQQKDLLRLFAGQAVSALERALRYERKQWEGQVDSGVWRILQRMGDPAEEGSLDRLLHAIRDELTAYVPVPNFVVVLKSRDTDGSYIRLHIENNAESHKPYWRSNSEKGMIWCMLTYGHPLFLPQGTQEHRDKYGLQQVGNRSARSWMAAPLRIGDQISGALIVEDDDRENVFRPDHFDLLQALTDRLAAVIQTAWLNEQERAYSELLRQLQEASELSAGLDEEKLWLTTLTLCIANYGASFERAMLFLAEEGGARLRGRMAIGHLQWEDAKFDWEEDVRVGTDWDKFLAVLQVGSIAPTPLYGAVRDYAFAVGGDAFAEVLQGKGVIVLSKEEAQTRLPADFLARFDVTAYCLLPVKAADQMIGVVVLDNIWGKTPRRVGVLDILDSLFNQAGLLYENLRKTRAQEQLIAVQHEVLVQAVNRPLQETLQRICEAIQSIAGADLVAIYPLQDNGEPLLYEHSHSARVGRHNLANRPLSHTPTGLSKYVLLDAKQPVLIPDVAADKTLYCGERRGDAPIVGDEGIRATIAAPILGVRTGKPRAMLYIDYHTPRQFTEHDRQIAEAFAHLAATAISNWRDAQGLRDTQEAREEELRRLGQVLEGALAAESNERQIVELLLDAVPALFAPLPVTTGITLKEWMRSASDPEPVEMHHYFYPEHSPFEEQLIPVSLDKGIPGRTMVTGRIENIANAHYDPHYRERDKNTRSELDVPILVDGQVVGALNVESPLLAAFTRHHEEMAQRFAHVAALALGNVRRQRNLLTVLSVASAVTGPMDFKEVLDKIVAEVRLAIPNLSMLVIWYLDPYSHQPRLGSYFGVRDVAAMRREPPRKAGVVQKGLILDGSYSQPNVAADPLFQDSSFVTSEGIQSTAIFPLRAQGKPVGVMFFSYREWHEFTDEERHLYPILAEVVASTISDALQLHQTERERKRLRATQKVTEVISSSATAEHVITGVRQTLADLYPRCAVYLARYNERTGSLDLPSEVGRHAVHADTEPDCFPCQLAEESLRTGKEQVRIKHHSKRKDKSRPLQSGTHTSLGATLVSGSDNGTGRLLGVLVLESPQEDAFDRDDEAIISNVAQQARIAMERVEQEASDRFQSTVIGHTAWATPIIHDINQYTGRILRRIERLQRETTLTAAGRQALSELHEQTQKMSDQMTAVDLRREELTPVAIDAELPQWIADTLSERSVPISLTLDLNTPYLQVSAYPKALRRAIYDLTRNAIEAMGWEETGQQLCVSTRPTPDGGQVEIRIYDNGSAIPNAVQSKLFNEIYSSKGEERGIGLLFVRAAIERMDGEVWLESSTEEGGTTFVVRLKVAAAQNEREGDQ